MVYGLSLPLLLLTSAAYSRECEFVDDFFADNYYIKDLNYSNETTLAQAEELALSLSPNELLAPPDLVEKINADLTDIRRADPKTNAVQPALRYTPGELSIFFTEDTTQEIRDGTYSLAHVDRIMNTFGPVTRDPEFGSSSLTYRFEARYNVNVLIDMLQPTAESIPGFQSLQPSIPSGNIGLWFSACPISTAEHQSESTSRTYIFDFGWNDCINSCTCREVLAYIVMNCGVWRTEVHVGPRSTKFPGPDDCLLVSSPSATPTSTPTVILTSSVMEQISLVTSSGPDEDYLAWLFSLIAAGVFTISLFV